MASMGRPALICLLSVIRRLRLGFGRQSVGRTDVSTRASVRIKFGRDRVLGAVSYQSARGASLAPSLRLSADRCIKRDQKVCEVRDVVAGESRARR
jgi:hypothetical protein